MTYGGLQLHLQSVPTCLLALSACLPSVIPPSNCTNEGCQCGLFKLNAPCLLDDCPDSVYNFSVCIGLIDKAFPFDLRRGALM
jgi:hypothetical protein